VCRLFPFEEKSYTELIQINGWIMRCEACLEAERKVEDQSYVTCFLVVFE